MTTSAIKLAIYRFELEPLGYLPASPYQRGVILRGALGWMLRRQVCPDFESDCLACDLQSSCPYRLIFSPTNPAGSERLSKNLHPPRPFILRPDLSEKRGYQEGEPFTFELVLIGYCIDFLPFFIVAFKHLGESGIGPQRTKYGLKRIWGINPFRTCQKEERIEEEEIYDDGNNQVRSCSRHPIYWEDIEKRAGELPPNCLTLRFQSPTEIKADGRIVREPDFHHIFKRLRDRINALSYFYCGQAMEISFSEIGKLAEEVKTVHSTTNWLSRVRKSSRTGQDQVLSGMVGDITFRGNLKPFLPYLAVGEYLHVGKDVAFGNGRYEVIRT